MRSGGLKHPSLPEYREFHRDYMVMDYIDGTTLAAMIARKDPWLRDEKHLRSMLRQLVEVVDYLHRHNVVHCGIKPGSIMRPLNLADSYGPRATPSRITSETTRLCPTAS